MGRPVRSSDGTGNTSVTLPSDTAQNTSVPTTGGSVPTTTPSRPADAPTGDTPGSQKTPSGGVNRSTQNSGANTKSRSSSTKSATDGDQVKTGPAVDTGGTVEKGWIARIASLFA